MSTTWKQTRIVNRVRVRRTQRDCSLPLARMCCSDLGCESQRSSSTVQWFKVCQVRRLKLLERFERFELLISYEEGKIHGGNSSCNINHSERQEPQAQGTGARAGNSHHAGGL